MKNQGTAARLAGFPRPVWNVHHLPPRPKASVLRTAGPGAAEVGEAAAVKGGIS